MDNLKTVQKMGLLPTDIQTYSQNKLFSILHIFLYFFNRLNSIWSSRQKYGLIGNFKTFQEMGQLPTDIETKPRKKKFRFFHIFLFYFLNTSYFSINYIIELAQLQNKLHVPAKDKLDISG